MFQGYLPPCNRISSMIKRQTTENLRKYGREKVCVLFRFILSEISTKGVDIFWYDSFGDIMGRKFPILLHRAYLHGKPNKQKGGRVWKP